MTIDSVPHVVLDRLQELLNNASSQNQLISMCRGTQCAKNIREYKQKIHNLKQPVKEACDKFFEAMNKGYVLRTADRKILTNIATAPSNPAFDGIFNHSILQRTKAAFNKMMGRYDFVRKNIQTGL